MFVLPRDGSGEVALILVKAGADLTARNNEGERKSTLYFISFLLRPHLG